MSKRYGQAPCQEEGIDLAGLTEGEKAEMCHYEAAPVAESSGVSSRCWRFGIQRRIIHHEAAKTAKGRAWEFSSFASLRLGERIVWLRRLGGQRSENKECVLLPSRSSRLRGESIFSFIPSGAVEEDATQRLLVPTDARACARSRDAFHGLRVAQLPADHHRPPAASFPRTAGIQVQ